MRFLSTAVAALIISLACYPPLLADEPDGLRITIRITSDGIVIGSVDGHSDSACNGSAKGGTQIVCRGLKIQAVKGRTARLEITDVVVPPAFAARPVVSEFRVWPAGHQGVVRADGAGPPRVPTWVPTPQPNIALPTRPCVAAPAVVYSAPAVAHLDAIDPKPEMPKIPELLMPKNGYGSVVEYWPNGQTKSKREYQDGKIVTAVYYASDGTVVFEMSSNDP